VKTTPAALWPAAALPMDRVPLGESVIPEGSALPLDETPNVPPLWTPLGSVGPRSIVPATPEARKSVARVQAAGPEGEGLGEGPGVGVGDAEPGDGVSRLVTLSSNPLQAARTVAQVKRPTFSARRRLIPLITFSDDKIFEANHVIER